MGMSTGQGFYPGFAIGTGGRVVPRQRAAKGYFITTALGDGDGPVFVCEGPFDALALMAAGYSRAVAIFGVNGWRWEWAQGVREIVLALDSRL